MALTTVQTEEIVKKFKRADLDTGSPEVQVALMTARINDLTAHFTSHKKDFHGRRGLVAIVSQRRKLLDYLRRTNLKKYEALIKELELRK